MGRALTASALFMFNSCLAVFLTYGVFFNRIASEFNQPPTSTSLAFASFALMYSLSSLTLGFLMDHYGPSKTILVSGLLMTTGLLASSSAASIAILILTFGIVGGAGSGAIWLSTSFVVLSKFKPKDIRSVTGLVSAGSAFGSFFLAPLEAFLIDTVGWRAAFIVLGVIVLTITLAAAAASTIPARPKIERLRQAIQKAKNRRFQLLYFYYALGGGFSRSIVMLFVVPMLESRGVSLLAASLALSMIGAGSIFGRFSTNIKWFTEEEIAGLSFILQGFSSILLIYLQGLIPIIIVSLIFGLGYGGYIPQFSLLVRKYYGIEEYGSLFGILLTSFGIGAFTGPILAGYGIQALRTFAPIFWVAGLTSVMVGLHQIFNKVLGEAPSVNPQSGYETRY